MSLIWPFSVSISMQMHPLHHRPTVGSYIYTDTALTLLPWQRQGQKYFGLLKLRFRVILTKIHCLELWTFGVIDSSYYSWIHSHLMEEWLSILFSVPVPIQIILDFLRDFTMNPITWALMCPIQCEATLDFILVRAVTLAAPDKIRGDRSSWGADKLSVRAQPDDRHHDFSSSVEF